MSGSLSSVDVVDHFIHGESSSRSIRRAFPICASTVLIDMSSVSAISAYLSPCVLLISNISRHRSGSAATAWRTAACISSSTIRPCAAGSIELGRRAYGSPCFTTRSCRTWFSERLRVDWKRYACGELLLTSDSRRRHNSSSTSCTISSATARDCTIDSDALTSDGYQSRNSASYAFSSPARRRSKSSLLSRIRCRLKWRYPLGLRNLETW
jgi:hypothetical protein